MNRKTDQKLFALVLFLFLFATFVSSFSPVTAQSFTSEASATGGFNSQFNRSMAGWASMGSVKMDVNSKYLFTSGVPGYWGQAYYNKAKFTNFTYTVYLKRLYDQHSANCIFVDMGTLINKKQNLWYPGYAFCHGNYSGYAIFKRTAAGGTVVIQGWTKSPAISIMGWNEMKVVASGNTFKFYINNQLLKTFNAYNRTGGYVGIGCYDAGVYREQLRVDWATLTGN